MQSGGFKIGLARQRGVFGIRGGRLRGIVPKRKHCAHGNIYPAARDFISPLAEKKQIDNCLICLNGSRGGIFVYIFKIYNALIILINIKKPGLSQKLIINGIKMAVKIGLRGIGGGD